MTNTCKLLPQQVMCESLVAARRTLETSRPTLPDIIGSFNAVARQLEELDVSERQVPLAEGVHEFAGPRFSLPQGAAECEQTQLFDFGLAVSLVAGRQFTTLISNICVSHGKWMYEVVLNTDGLLQIGWSTAKQLILWSSKKGVGDFPHTVGYDGFRKQLWAVQGRPCGWRWTIGDVVSCCFDADAGLVSFYQNGEFVTEHPLPTVGSLTKGGVCTSNYDANLLYFPALSLAAEERCDVNFGKSPFMYPIEGYSQMTSAGASWKRRIQAVVSSPFEDPAMMRLFASIVFRPLNEATKSNLNAFVGSLMDLFLDVFGSRKASYGPARVADMFRLFQDCFAPCVFEGVVQMFLGAISWFSSIRPIHMFLREPPTPSQALACMHHLVCSVPAAASAWMRSPMLKFDLISSLWIKTPNNQDLTFMFPESMSDAINSKFPEVADAARADIRQRFAELVNGCILPDNTHRIDLVSALMNDELGCQTLVFMLEATIQRNHQVTGHRLDGAVATRLLTSVVGALKKCSFQGPSATVAPDRVLAEAPDERVGGAFDFLAKKSPLAFNPAASPPRTRIVYLTCALYEKVVRDYVSEACGSVATQQNLWSLLTEATSSGAGEERIATLKEELTKVARPVGWNKITLFLSLDYEALMGFAGLVASHLLHLLERDPVRLSYIPVVMLKCVPGIVHFARKTCSTYAELIKANPSTVSLFFKFFRAPEVRHGETAEFMMHTLAGIFDVYPANRSVVAGIVEHHRKYFVATFIPRLVVQLNHEMAWTVAANAMFRFNVGRSFAAVLDEDSAEWIKSFGLNVSASGATQSIYADLLREFLLAGDILNHKATPSSLLKDVLIHANWCLSELSVGLGHPSVTDPKPNESALGFRRRLVSVFDFARKLLHLLELILQEGYELLFVQNRESRILKPKTAVSMVCELLVQCLVRFCDEKSPLDQLSGSPGLERLSVKALAAPVMGCTLRMFPDVTPASLDANPFVAHFRGPRNEFPFEIWWGVLKRPWASICAETRCSGEGLSRIQDIKVALSQIELTRENCDAKEEPTEESTCFICCLNEIDVCFDPCGHRCCEDCAQRHLVHSSSCFFCKAHITSLKPL